MFDSNTFLRRYHNQVVNSFFPAIDGISTSQSQALIEKVDVFSTRFNVIDWTKDECYERLRRSKPIHSHRFGSEKALFERYEAVSGNWHIRRYVGDSEIWEEVMTIFVDPPMKYCGVVFRDTKFFVIGGSTRDEKFSKSVCSLEMLIFRHLI